MSSVAEELNSCLIRFLSKDGNVNGTGFLVGDGYILTAYHVISDLVSQSEEIAISLSDNVDPIRDAHIVEIYEDRDVVLLQVKKPSPNVGLPLVDKGESKPGNHALIGGFQLAERLNQKPYLAEGTINNLDKDGNLVLDTALLPGMSGAPVYDLSCRKVTGIITSRIIRDGANLVTHTALAVPIEDVIAKWGSLRSINDRIVYDQYINVKNQFRHSIAQILKDDLDAHIETDVLIDGEIMDIIASWTRLGRIVSTWIRCYPYIVELTDVNIFNSFVSQQREKGVLDDGRIVVGEMIPEKLQKTLKGYKFVSIVTRMELEDEALGLKTYVEHLIDDYESNEEIIAGERIPLIPEMATYNIRQYYVSSNAVDDQEQHYEPIEKFFDQWLDDQQSNLVGLVENNDQLGQVSILGDSGSGKTSFCLHLCYEVARQWQKNRVGRVPLYIPLSDYSPHRGLEDLITGILVDTYKLRNVNATKVLRYAVDKGYFLLIFDGFDEMASTGGESDVKRRFEEISKYAEKRGKVVLTCRTNFFLLEEEAARTLSPNDVATGLLRQNQRRKFNILYIEAFGEKQILEFLSRHPAITGKEQKWWANIQKISRLATLSTRPLLLRMIVDTLPTLEDALPSSMTVAELYSTFIDRLIHRDAGRHLILDTSETYSFLQILALDVLRSPMKSFRWDTLPPKTDSLVNDLKSKKKQPNYVDFDLRINSLLQLRGEHFSFIHGSFAEFLAAYRIAGLLTKNDVDVLTDYYQEVLSEGVRSFIVGIVDSFRHNGSFSYFTKTYENPTKDIMFLIPAGPFISGYGSEMKIITLDAPVYIGKYPVTWRDYGRFNPQHLKNFAREIKNELDPVTWVSWDDALMYCDWLSKQSKGKTFRLPTTVEWEKAARGIDGRLYPWGDNPVTPERANYSSCGYGGTTPVDTFPLGISPYGLCDMAGNVWELTSTPTIQEISHLCLGGSWQEPALRLLCSAKREIRFRASFPDVGFRIALDATDA